MRLINSHALDFNLGLQYIIYKRINELKQL
jgi:hypothetical protein